MGYKIIGFLVVKGTRAYLRQRYGMLASRRTVAGAIVALAVVGLASRAALREARD